MKRIILVLSILILILGCLQAPKNGARFGEFYEEDLAKIKVEKVKQYTQDTESFFSLKVTGVNKGNGLVALDERIVSVITDDDLQIFSLNSPVELMQPNGLYSVTFDYKVPYDTDYKVFINRGEEQIEVME